MSTGKGGIGVRNGERKNHLDKLIERYSLEKVETDFDILEGIAKRRGLLLTQGQYDIEKAEVLLLKEFKEGLIVKTIVDELC